MSVGELVTVVRPPPAAVRTATVMTMARVSIVPAEVDRPV